MQVNIGEVSVYIGMPVYGRIPHHTALSLALTLHACGAGGVPVEVGMKALGIVTWARDAVLDGFLKSDKQKLFWIDSDMVWSPESFARMVALSTKRDVIAAAYMAKRDGEPDFQIGASGKPQELDEYGLLEIEATGLGFTIMDRKVCEALAEGKPQRADQHGKPYIRAFRIDEDLGEFRAGEDVQFFADIRAKGFKVHLDPTIDLGHIGEKMWRGRAIDHMKGAE
jgi:hypothetical protein